MNQDRPEAADIPPDLKGDALRKWAYQHYIKDYLRCIAAAWTTTSAACSIIWTRRAWRKNTIVIYTSDQGFFLGDHGWFDKRLMYEESLRMPFLMRYPGRDQARARSIDDMVLNIDFAADVPRLRRRESPGRNAGPQLPRRSSKATRRRTGASRCTTATGCTTTSDHHVPAHYGVRTERWKLIYYYGKPLGMTGAIDGHRARVGAVRPAKDPHEMHNLYDDPKYAKVVKELKAELDRLQRAVGDTPA